MTEKSVVKSTVETGLYEGLSNEDYHRGPGISKSHIHTLLEDSPQKYFYKYIDPADPVEPTAAMDIGQATHTAVFEPELFDSEIIIEPEINKRTNAGKAEYAEFCEANKGKVCLKKDVVDDIWRISDAVRNHKRAGAIVKAKGIAESSIFARLPDSDLLVKVRPDWLVPGLNLEADLKTCLNAHYSFFSREIFNRTYYLQAGMYLYVSRLAGIDVDKFVFIVVEKTAPFAVAVYNADKEMLELGLAAFQEGVELYLRCMESGYWPGYNSDEIVPVSLPKWAATQLMQGGLR